MLGRRQGRQVKVHPQVVCAKGMAEGSALPPKQGLTPLTELRDMDRCEDLQRTGERRLLRKTWPPPCLSQGQIGAQARIDLDDGTTPRQYTDEQIQQLARGCMIHGFQRQAQVGEDRGQKVRPGEAIPQDTQGAKEVSSGISIN